MDPEKRGKIELLLRSLIQREQQQRLPWKPIADAPKDGTLIFVYLAKKGEFSPSITCTVYHKDAGWWSSEISDATHFLLPDDLLPFAPKEPLP